MRKFLSCLFVIAALSVLGGEAETVEIADAAIDQKLKLATCDGADSKILRQFEVTIAGLPAQALKDGGIRLAVTIFNKGAEAVQLENPVDYLTYMLKDQAGRQIAMPKPKPRGEILSLKETVREPRKLAFKVLSVALNERKMTEKEFDADTLTLAPNAKLRIEFEIDKCAKAPYVAPEQPELTPLSAGRHSLRFRVALLLHKEDGTAWFDSAALDDAGCVRVLLK